MAIKVTLPKSHTSNVKSILKWLTISRALEMCTHTQLSISAGLYCWSNATNNMFYTNMSKVWRVQALVPVTNISVQSLEWYIQGDFEVKYLSEFRHIYNGVRPGQIHVLSLQPFPPVRTNTTTSSPTVSADATVWNILVVFTMILTIHQFVGERIKCWSPAHFTRAHIRYTQAYCWVQNSYYLPWEEDVRYDTRERHYIAYYQWVQFILLGQVRYHFLHAPISVYSCVYFVMKIYSTIRNALENY